MSRLMRIAGAFASVAAAAVVLALISHILILFALPLVAATAPGSRLAADAPVNAPTTAVSSVMAAMPYADPAIEAAVCAFDLSGGPVRLRAPIGENFLSIALLRPDGRIVFAVTDRAATRRLLELRVMTAQQKRRLEALDADDEPVAELRIVSPEATGVALVRAFAPTTSAAEQARTQLALFSCRAEPEALQER
jgi:uncharacterized membrane protein